MKLFFKNVLVGDVWLCSGQKQYGGALSSSEGYKEELNQKRVSLSLDILKLKEKNKFFTLKITLQKQNGMFAECFHYWRFSAVAYFLLKNVSRKTSSYRNH